VGRLRWAKVPGTVRSSTVVVANVFPERYPQMPVGAEPVIACRATWAYSWTTRRADRGVASEAGMAPPVVVGTSVVLLG